MPLFSEENLFLVEMFDETFNVYTGCPEKNAPQLLPDISGYIHPRKLGHI